MRTVTHEHAHVHASARTRVGRGDGNGRVTACEQARGCEGFLSMGLPPLQSPQHPALLASQTPTHLHYTRPLPAACASIAARHLPVQCAPHRVACAVRCHRCRAASHA